jgi:hypothetical protein
VNPCASNFAEAAALRIGSAHGLECYEGPVSALLAALLSLSSCPGGPAPELVLERAASLRGASSPAVPWALHFARGDAGLVLEASVDGHAWRRPLPADASCEALAQAAAVVVLTLERSLDVPVGAPRTVVTPTSAAQRAEVLAPVSDVWRWSLGIAQGVMLAWSDFPWALVGRVWLRPPSGVVGLSAALRAQASRSASLAGGHVWWHRAPVSLGPDFRFLLGDWSLSLQPELAAGPTWVHAETPLGSASFLSWNLGLQASVRLAPVVHGPWAPWVEVSAVDWLRREVVAVEGTDRFRLLPPVEVSVSVGVAWGA